MRRAFALLLLALPSVAFAETHSEGIPLKEIGLHAFNFLLLIGLLVYLLRTPVRDFLNTRSAQVRKELEDADKQRSDAEARYKAIQSKLAHFEEELTSMKADGVADAEREAQQTAERAVRDAAHLKETAERAIREETAMARNTLRRDAVDLAVKLAEESLRSQLGPADQQQLAQEFLASIPKEGTANG